MSFSKFAYSKSKTPPSNTTYTEEIQNLVKLNAKQATQETEKNQTDNFIFTPIFAKQNMQYHSSMIVGDREWIYRDSTELQITSPKHLSNAKITRSLKNSLYL